MLLAAGYAEGVQEYTSFILLGLSLTVGYIIWRTFQRRPAPTGERTTAEAALLAELTRARMKTEEDGSGLAGPRRDASAQSIIDQATPKDDPGSASDADTSRDS